MLYNSIVQILVAFVVGLAVLAAAPLPLPTTLGNVDVAALGMNEHFNLPDVQCAYRDPALPNHGQSLRLVHQISFGEQKEDKGDRLWLLPRDNKPTRPRSNSAPARLESTPPSRPSTSDSSHSSFYNPDRWLTLDGSHRPQNSRPVDHKDPIPAHRPSTPANSPPQSNHGSPSSAHSTPPPPYSSGQHGHPGGSPPPPYKKTP